jgi:hypothetical protein
LNPHPQGGGKPIYHLLDAGIAHYLGASLLRRLQIVLLNERMAYNHYFEAKANQYYYYRSTGKNHIHLIESTLDGKVKAFMVSDRDSVNLVDIAILKAFQMKCSKAELHWMAPVRDSYSLGGVKIQSWETIVRK